MEYFGLIGAVILLAVLAAALLPLVFDEEDLKGAISAEVHRQTGRELSIEGALDFSVFPWLALEVGDLSLSNAEGFGEQPLAEIGQARVGVALMPLLRRQISVDEVRLDGLALNLAVDSSGRSNWEDLAAAGATAEPAPADEKQPSAGEMTLAGLAIGGVEITDAGVIWDDQQAAARYEISGLNLLTGAIAPQQRDDLTFANIETYALNDVALAVVGMHIPD